MPMEVGPDHAVGWGIALACFFINFIMAGLARTAGVLYVALVEVYGVSREAASTPFSIRVCVRNMSGPFIGLLGQKYGIRRITTIGGLVAGLGSILCYFAPSIDWIIGFWGVVHGTGFGLSTVLHMMVISQYFDKYKASALGLGYSGDCFGTFAFPVIMEHLLSTYDIKGTFLILGGIVLNVIPLAMILKKPPWLKGGAELNLKSGDSERIKSEGFINEGFMKPSFEEENSLSAVDSSLLQDKLRRITFPANSSPRSASFCICERHDSLPPLYEREVLENLNDSRKCVENEENGDAAECAKNGRISSVMNITNSLKNCVENEENDATSDCVKKSMASSVVKLTNSLKTCVEDEEYDATADCIKKSNISSAATLTNSLKKCVENEEIDAVADCVKKGRTSSVVSQIAQELVHRVRSASFASQIAQDAFITPIQQDQKENFQVPHKANVERMNSAISNNSNFQELILTVNVFIKTEEPSSRVIVKNETKSPGIMYRLLRLNTKPIFILISLSMAVYSFLFVGVLTIIIDYATDNDISSDDGKYLIIGFSVTDLIGRLSFGLVLDRKLIKMKNYSGVTLLLMGTFVAVIPFNKSFNFMLVFMCMYGFVQGGTAIMFPILISYYMKKNEESLAMGCLNFFGGLLMLVLAPMIGYFRDSMKSYDWVFHIVGSVTLVVGLLWQFEPLILRYQQRLKQRRLDYVIVTKL